MHNTFGKIAFVSNTTMYTYKEDGSARGRRRREKQASLS